MDKKLSLSEILRITTTPSTTDVSRHFSASVLVMALNGNSHLRKNQVNPTIKPIKVQTRKSCSSKNPAHHSKFIIQHSKLYDLPSPDYAA